MKDSTLNIIKNKKINIVIYITGIVILLLLWEILSITKQNELFPSILTILKSLKNILIDKKTYVMLFLTLLRIIISLAISYLISLFIITLYHIYKPSINLFKPFLSIMKSMPVIILTLLIWLIMDVNIGIYIITIFLTTPLIVEALTNGLDNINQDILEYIKLDTNNNLNVLFKLKMPMIKNYVMLSLLQTLGLSLKVMIMSEYIFNIKMSIGKELYFIKGSLEVNNLLAWTIIVIIMLSSIEYILKKIKSKIN